MPGDDVTTLRPLGLAHLTCLDVSPPELVAAAAAAGFAAVGLRAVRVHADEARWPLTPGSAMLADVRQRLADTGLAVWDVEVARLGPGVTVDDLEPLLEVGAALGARFVNVFPAEPDHGRLAADLHALAERAAPYGLRPLIEPMRYNSTPNLQVALDVVAAADHPGLGLIVDTLHVSRFGVDPAALAALDPDLLPSLQLADGPRAEPTSAPVLPPGARLPRGQSLDAPPLALEARAFRLLPGEGELPLAAVARAMPPTSAVSVEAPCWTLQQTLPLDEYLTRALTGACRALEDPAPNA